MFEIKKSDFFESGKEGVKKILTPDDKKIDIVEFDDKTLCIIHRIDCRISHSGR